jgi:hypothetical protein
VGSRQPDYGVESVRVKYADSDEEQFCIRRSDERVRALLSTKPCVEEWWAYPRPDINSGVWSE